MTGAEAIQFIRDQAVQLGADISAIVDCLLSDHRFAVWSGSDANTKHHYGKAGLVIHTAEVIKLGLAVQATLSLPLDAKEWFLAALFHDVGKMYDYAPVNVNDFAEWKGTEHKRLIHHISRSGVYWSQTVAKFPELNHKYHDLILHAILAHHGQREWGSPVAPKTRVAWLLHLCYNVSARMNDCEKYDLLKLRRE